MSFTDEKLQQLTSARGAPPLFTEDGQEVLLIPRALVVESAQDLLRLRQEVRELLHLLDGLPAKPVSVSEHRHYALFQQTIERLMDLVPDWKAE